MTPRILLKSLLPALLLLAALSCQKDHPYNPVQPPPGPDAPGDTLPPLLSAYLLPDSSGRDTLDIAGWTYDTSGIGCLTVNGDTVDVLAGGLFKYRVPSPAAGCTVTVVSVDGSPHVNRTESRRHVGPRDPFSLTGTWQAYFKRKVDGGTGDIVYEYDTDTVYALRLSFYGDGTMQRFTITDGIGYPRFAFLLYEHYTASADSIREFPDSLFDTLGARYDWDPADSTFSPPFPVFAYPLKTRFSFMSCTHMTEKRDLYGYKFYFYFRKVSDTPQDLMADVLNAGGHPLFAKARVPAKPLAGGSSVRWDIAAEESLR
jgi:hypothetical protein